MSTPVQPPLEFIPPAFNPILFQVMRSLLPIYRCWNRRITRIQVDHAAILADLYRQFQDGETRFLLAFRHPSVNDPFCLAHLLWQAVPQAAREQGISLKGIPHVHLIYDRGIPLWAGQGVGWLGSQLGGTPIRRGKIDLVGLRSARNLFASGTFPMAAAPEGATNGHNEVVSPLEPGIAQFGFWCVEDLLKDGRSPQVLIVPVGIQYFLVDAPWKSLESFLRQLEAESGLHTTPSPVVDTLEDSVALTPEQEKHLYQRLFGLGEHLLAYMEEFYRRFYHQPIPKATEADGEGAIANEQLATRLQTLLNAALTVAEQHFNIAPKGTLTDRCRRLEQAGWDRIYREDLKQLESLSAVERGLADRIAEEADLRLWHMRVVESFVSVTGRYVLEKPTIDRFSETLFLLWDMIARITGRAIFPRPPLGQQWVQMTMGTPLSVSDRWSEYQSNRRQAVTALTQTLQTTLEAMIR